MSLTADQLYALLPAVYRSRDAAAGGPLRALVGVLAAQSDIVADNLGQLYDDHFIETCAPWVIPYLGDLVGYNSRYELSAVTDSRAEIANTIGYRRRKGTKIALQQVALDVSARPVIVVEEFRRLITTQSARLPRPGTLATVSVRDAGLPAPQAAANGLTDSPFDLTSRAIDVRRIAPPAPPVAADPATGLPLPDKTPFDMSLHGPGRASIPDVSVHLWRWQAFPVTRAPVSPVDGSGGRSYRFGPFGADLPLFTPSRPPGAAFAAFLTRADMPAPIARTELAQCYASGAVVLTTDGVAVDPTLIYPANLASAPDGGWGPVPAGLIAVDPELGRIQLGADVPLPGTLEVSYWYGLPAPVGGGPYDRSAALAGALPASPGFTASVVGPTAAAGSADYPTLASAVAAWNEYATAAGDSGAAAPTGVIRLPAFASQSAGTAAPQSAETTGTTGKFTAQLVDASGIPAIQLPPGGRLVVTVALDDGNALFTQGDLEVTGLPPAGPAGGTVPEGGQLVLSGIWLTGQLTVSGAPCTVAVSDCTLVPGLRLLPVGTPANPGEPSVQVTATGASLLLTRVISCPVAAAESATVRVTGSILDATTPYDVAYAGPDLASADPASAGPDLRVEGSTIIGKVRARTIAFASDSIFHARLGDADPWPAPVWASRLQAGFVRFCYLPAGSRAPSQYECLPPAGGTQEDYRPRFVATRYGDPSYALLSGDCPVAVWTGADNGSQLGVYQQAQETEAVRNVAIRVPEYLPARLEAGIFLHPARATGPPGPPGNLISTTQREQGA